MASPQDSPDPAALLQFMEQVDPLIAALAGVKQKFIENGFSEEFAEEMTKKIVEGGLDAATGQKRGRR